MNRAPSIHFDHTQNEEIKALDLERLYFTSSKSWFVNDATIADDAACEKQTVLLPFTEAAKIGANAFMRARYP